MNEDTSIAFKNTATIGEKSDKEDGRSMVSSRDEPTPKGPPAKVKALLSSLVQVWLVEHNISMHVLLKLLIKYWMQLKEIENLIEYSKENNWQSSEKNVEDGNRPTIIKSLSGESVVEWIPKLGKGKGHTLIERVFHHLTVPNIVPSSVNHQQTVQKRI